MKDKAHVVNMDVSTGNSSKAKERQISRIRKKDSNKTIEIKKPRVTIRSLKKEKLTLPANIPKKAKAFFYMKSSKVQLDFGNEKNTYWKWWGQNLKSKKSEKIQMNCPEHTLVEETSDPKTKLTR